MARQPELTQHPILISAARFHQQALYLEAAAAQRLVDAYTRVYARLEEQRRALVAEIEAAPELDRRSKRLFLDRIRSLQKQVREEIDRFAIYADQEISSAAREMIRLSLTHSEQLVLDGFPAPVQAAIRGSFNRLPVEAVETLLGFLAEGSPLHDALTTKLGAEVAGRVGNALIEGIGVGLNPRDVARIMQKEMGLGLTWAMNTARTAQLWAYREATRANYVANNHVVKGWVWQASLDDRTCLSCVAKHGTIHPLTEPLEDHHSGRCAALPEVKTLRELGVDMDVEVPEMVRGEDWFRSLPDTAQMKRMGPAMFDAWKAGRFDFRDLSRSYTDPVYGQMFREASLKDLLGAAARDFYKRGR